jgi:hypothetical protein
VNGRRGGEPVFDVWFTPIGREDYGGLRADLQRHVDAAVVGLGREGCAAAHYRLAGAERDVGRICVMHLLHTWRLVLGFPSATEVAVLLIGRHLRGPRSIYQRLYRVLGVEEPTEERDKPPCRDDGASSVAAELVDRIVANAKRLRRRRA